MELNNHDPAVAIIIPARMESSRLPGKPLLETRGKPLIQWAIEAAAASKLAGFVAVATDSSAIYDWCFDRRFDRGYECILQVCSARPFVTGSDRVAATAESAGPFKIVVNLQCDEPEITGKDLDRLIAEVQLHRRPVATYAFTGISDIARHSRDTVKLVIDDNRDAIYFSRKPFAGSMWIHAGVYAYRFNELRSFANHGQSTLEKAENLEQLRLIEAGVPIRVLDLGRPVVSINTEDDLREWNAG